MTGTTGVLWPSLYQGDGTRIRKWLYGSVLIRDWDSAGSTNMEDIVVFQQDGNLNPALLQPVSSGGYGFYDLGSITDNGVEFNPQFKADETYIWQSRRTQRTDITQDDEEITFSCSESTPLIDYLWYNMPIGFTGVPFFPAIGDSGYTVTKPFYSDVVYRQLLIIGVDGSVGPNGQPEYIIELRPRVSLSKKAKKQWAAKQVDVTELSYYVHVDPWSGFDSQTLRGGSVWLAEGGVIALPTVSTVTGTAVTGAKANLVFNAPSLQNDGVVVGAAQTQEQDNVTYTATKTAASTTTAATIATTTTTSGVVTLVVTGLTASTSYTFAVTATGANGQSIVYPNSNSVTAIA